MSMALLANSTSHFYEKEYTMDRCTHCFFSPTRFPFAVFGLLFCNIQQFAEDAARIWEFMKQALLIVDHGSVRAESNEMLADVARKLQELCPVVPVHFAHMELAEPTIAQGFEKCVHAGAEEVVVHPYMLGPGRHATKDIPSLVAACAGKFPGIKFRVTAPLGIDRKICEVVLERAGMS